MARCQRGDEVFQFSYSISHHGMPTIKRMGMYAALKEAGAPFSSQFLVYKAGKAPVKMPPGPLDWIEETFWISRRMLLHMMLRHLQVHGIVLVHLGVSVGEVRYSNKEATVHMLRNDGEDAGIIHADLVLACDGLRSAVQRQLREAGRAGATMPESRCGFESYKTSSSSTGILYKSLCFGASPKLSPLSDDTEHHLTLPEELVWFRGRRSRSVLSAFSEKSFILFPAGSDPKEERYGSIGGPLDSPMWKVKTAVRPTTYCKKTFHTSIYGRL